MGSQSVSTSARPGWRSGASPATHCAARYAGASAPGSTSAVSAVPTGHSSRTGGTSSAAAIASHSATLIDARRPFSRSARVLRGMGIPRSAHAAARSSADIPRAFRRWRISPAMARVIRAAHGVCVLIPQY